ncbi:TPA: hypothetical protein HA246_01185 [Candidatus Woesearchaeota archaeon]|nr:hypothetical protein [Candidatus Woesearchaeota archaeon]
MATVKEDWISKLEMHLADPSYKPSVAIIETVEKTLQNPKSIYGKINSTKVSSDSTTTFGDASLDYIVSWIDNLVDGAVITFTGGKGGVGKSLKCATLATNICDRYSANVTGTLVDLDGARKLHGHFTGFVDGYDSTETAQLPQEALDADPERYVLKGMDAIILNGASFNDSVHPIRDHPNLFIVPGKGPSTHAFTPTQRKGFMDVVADGYVALAGEKFGLLFCDVGAGSAKDNPVILEATSNWYEKKVLNHTVFVLDQNEPESPKDSYQLAIDTIEAILLNRYRYQGKRHSLLSDALMYAKSQTKEPEYERRVTKNPYTMKLVLQKLREQDQDDFASDILFFLQNKINFHVLVNKGTSQDHDKVAKSFINTLCEDYSLFRKKKVGDVVIEVPAMNYLGYIPDHQAITAARKRKQNISLLPHLRTAYPELFQLVDGVADRLVTDIAQDNRTIKSARQDIKSHELYAAHGDKLSDRMHEYILLKSVLERARGAI